MIVTGIDFETTGLDPAKDRITEIGAIQWESEGWVELGRYQTLVWDPSYPELSEEIQELCGFSQLDLVEGGKAPRQAFEELNQFIAGTDYIMAHNKEFDRGMLRSDLKRVFGEAADTAKPWVCSSAEVPYPAKYRCRRLSHLALDHGYAVDPTITHRADYDVSLIAEIMRHGSYRFEDILEFAKSPWVYIQAKVSYDEREKAKAAKFGWQQARGSDGPTFPKMWVYRVKEIQLEDFLTGLDFPTAIIRREEVEL